VTKPPRPRKAAPAPVPQGVDAPITVLNGIKGSLAEKFETLGVRTVRDLLLLFPRRHNDYSNLRQVGELTPGEDETVRVKIWSADEKRLGARKGTEATVGDESGMMKVVWFNMPFIARQLRTNSEIVLSGKVSLYKGRPTFENPEWELWNGQDELTHTGRLVPVYPSTAGLTGRNIRRFARVALDGYLDKLTDLLPEKLRKRLGLGDIRKAVSQAHYPDNFEELAKARRRLALDEMLPLQISVLLRRQLWQKPGTADAIALDEAMKSSFLGTLPFELTTAQQKTLDQLLQDLARDVPMSRLLQGDVGSGKTVVAAYGLLAAVASGRQAVMMAPTEVLADQHFRTICDLFGAESDGHIAEATPPYLDRPIRIGLLKGSMGAKQKAAVQEAISSGDVDIALGTHALIQDDVAIPNLGLAIVDEQHRFGVMQRAALRDKSERSVHMLVMTATPIPRSLYLTLYGDLDVSVIDELPPGRKPINTRWWPPDERDGAYEFLRGQVDAGRQAFVICPLVEESEALQAKSAIQEYERLKSDIYPDLELELVHGRMAGRDKDAAMERFRSGEAQILVSTSVIEVGIDIPNATVMMIEGADRFGVSQLHQFRGRVGRGADQSYCLLLSESPSLEAQERLRLLEETTDGFRLAQADLEIRGPGEFFGTMQSGLPDLRVASLLDTKLIELARTEAATILDDDPDLSKPENAGLKQTVSRLFERVSDELH
jgi:ATP-dependent DNA helicase RecG